MTKRTFIMILSFCTLVVAREDENYWRSKITPYSEKFGELIAQNKFSALLEFYDDDIILMRPFAPPIKGKKELQRAIQELYQVGMTYHSISGESAEVWGCGDQIFERGTMAFAYSTRENPKPQAYYGSMLTIWQKQKDETYKIKYSIWNLDFNPWEN